MPSPLTACPRSVVPALQRPRSRRCVPRGAPPWAAHLLLRALLQLGGDVGVGRCQLPRLCRKLLLLALLLLQLRGQLRHLPLLRFYGVPQGVPLGLAPVHLRLGLGSGTIVKGMTAWDLGRQARGGINSWPFREGCSFGRQALKRHKVHDFNVGRLGSCGDHSSCTAHKTTRGCPPELGAVPFHSAPRQAPQSAGQSC